MMAAIAKKLTLSAAICVAVAYSAHAEYGGGDNNKNKSSVSHVDAKTGIVVKQRKPNMYVRFFNRVYNKYAKKHNENIPTIVIEEKKESTGTNTKK